MLGVYEQWVRYGLAGGRQVLPPDLQRWYDGRAALETHCIVSTVVRLIYTEMLDLSQMAIDLRMFGSESCPSARPSRSPGSSRSRSAAKSTPHSVMRSTSFAETRLPTPQPLWHSLVHPIDSPSAPRVPRGSLA